MNVPIPPSWRARGLLLLFGTWTVFGLLFGTGYHFSASIRGNPRPLVDSYFAGLLDMYMWAFACLAAFLMAWRVPLAGRSWPRVLAIHVAVAWLVIGARITIEHNLMMMLDWPNPPFGVRIAGQGPSHTLLYLMLVGVGYAIEYFLRYRDREVRAAQLQAQLAGAQLQMLKMQLHPHFLFNTLNAISSLVRADAEAAERMIASLSDLLRATLDHEKAQEIPLREELELLQPYVEIERTRMGDRLQIGIEVDPGVMSALVPHLVLQPLVENAVRHGIAPRREGGRVDISARRDGGQLLLTVRDTGRGLPRDGRRHPGGCGIGIANTRARLTQLYGSAHRFELHSTPGEGTRVEMSIPLRSVPTEVAPMVTA